MLALAVALTVVLDPGHGGSEAGARGVVAGMTEKKATLAYARALKERLEAAGARVVLTRDGDQLVPIRERVRRANAARADLFVSLHLNASPDRTQRGFETYVLAREAEGREAREIELREGATGGDVAAIVSDLAQEAAEARAARVGRAIQDRLAHLLGAAGDRGLKQAPLDVLKGHRAPAVLVEVGFIDQAEEGRAIVSSEMIGKVADALAGAILESFREKKP
ncbi:MAG TPA: N-acetylmuramoyl-L-alanine amidase [Polyangia bacterium]|nr:N-acetylmuramoyl-L-alanine amidase [Polyangia bacterium]